MKKWKVIAFIPAIVLFGIVFLFPSVLAFKSSVLTWIVFSVGIILLVIIFYAQFKSKKVFLFLVLGVISTFASYAMVFILWKPYPEISIVMFPILLLYRSYFSALQRLVCLRGNGSSKPL